VPIDDRLWRSQFSASLFPFHFATISYPPDTEQLGDARLRCDDAHWVGPSREASVPQWQESQQPAQELSLRLYLMEVSSVDDYEAAFRKAVEARSTALWVTLNPMANSNQRKIADLAISHQLPSICARSDYSDNGCMMAYGPGYGIEGKDGARYVDRILKGAKPADVPVEQPMKFELVINLQTAHKLGIAIPQTVLFQADRVIR
jgi:ABC-type uncharacterized transport system substrate-binding protein